MNKVKATEVKSAMDAYDGSDDNRLIMNQTTN